MAEITAVDIAKQDGKNPKTYRRALRQEEYPWHAREDRAGQW